MSQACLACSSGVADDFVILKYPSPQCGAVARCISAPVFLIANDLMVFLWQIFFRIR